MAVESFGTWGSISVMPEPGGPGGHKFITDIGRTISGFTKNPKSTSFILQALSIEVQINSNSKKTRLVFCYFELQQQEKLKQIDFVVFG